MSDEKKKPMFRHESVFGNTFDDVAQRLQDVRNKLHEEGYTTHIEPVHEYLEHGYGYMIHGELRTAASMPMAVMPMSLSQLLEQMGGQQEGHKSQLSEKTKEFVTLAFSKVTGQRFSDAVKELPSIITSIASNFSVSDLSEIAEDLEKEVRDCGAEHLSKCSELQALSAIAATIQEKKRLNLQ